MREVIRRNGVDNGIIYIQMTRGVAPRDHAFPAKPMTQVVMTARRARPQPAKVAEEGVKAITMPDIRWKRCDIKSVSLLPNILAKQQAKEAGAYEAWLVDANGMVTEGSSTNAWIVTRDGQLVTRSLENAILAGITRGAVIALAREEGLSLVERPFSVSEAKTAREAFVTSTSSYVTPVTPIDDQVIANGRPGSISLKLRERYMRYMTGAAAVQRQASD
jgi:D-alanine transaminase